jgi:hypothetical protein
MNATTDFLRATSDFPHIFDKKTENCATRMSIERKLERIKSLNLDSRSQIEKYQGLIEELVSNSSALELQTVLGQCKVFNFYCPLTFV